MIKILMVTPFYYPTTIGGTESFIEAVSTELNQTETHADIMTFGLPRLNLRREEINNLSVIEVPARVHARILGRTFQINFIPLARFENLYKTYDIVHFHNDADMTFPAFSRFASNPKIMHCHCLVTGTYKIYKRNFLSRQLLKRVADIYIATSEYMAWMLSDLGVPKTKIRIVPIAINVDQYRSAISEKIENLLLFVGRLDPKKGLHILLKSLDYLKIPVRLVIIGPRSWDVEYSDKILSLIEKTQQKSFHELTYLGAINRKELIKWYQKASLLIRPDTIGASSGMTSLEALACATPVIGTGNEEGLVIIKNGVNGILVPPNNPIKLAQEISYLLDSNETRRRFGAEGRRFIASNFSTKIVAQKLLKIYEEII